VVLLFFVSTNIAIHAQDFISPAKMCKKLRHKRKTNKEGGGGLFSNKKGDVRIGHSDYIKNAWYVPVEEEEPLEALHMSLSIPNNFEDSNPDLKPIDVTNLPPTVNEKHKKIREEVLRKIKEGKSNEPMIESLYFITAEAEFAYVDFEPFLKAVEYALQGKMVLVEGHTDSRGDDDYNLKLSMSRVRQIERLMLDIGVPQDRISVIGYGETMPKYDNNTPEGRQKNRRVDFKIF